MVRNYNVRHIEERVTALEENGGGGGGGTTNYNNLSNKPSINGVSLVGNKTTEDLGIAIPTPYVLPTASTSQLGGVKIGSGVTVAEDGTISVAGGGSSSTFNVTGATTLYDILQALEAENHTYAYIPSLVYVIPQNSVISIGGYAKSVNTGNIGTGPIMDIRDGATAEVFGVEINFNKVTTDPAVRSHFILDGVTIQKNTDDNKYYVYVNRIRLWRGFATLNWAFGTYDSGNYNWVWNAKTTDSINKGSYMEWPIYGVNTTSVSSPTCPGTAFAIFNTDGTVDTDGFLFRQNWAVSFRGFKLAQEIIKEFWGDSMTEISASTSGTNIIRTPISFMASYDGTGSNNYFSSDSNTGFNMPTTLQPGADAYTVGDHRGKTYAANIIVA